MSPHNPFAPGDERHRVFEMAVVRDVQAFVAGDWASIESDFIEAGFFGLDARGGASPAGWRLTYPTLGAYRDRWQKQSVEFRARRYASNPAQAILGVLQVPLLELEGGSGVLLKRFDGVIRPAEGEPLTLRWESLFVLRRAADAWKIAGFVGYLPLSGG
jgi:hypothetical protein